MGPFPSVLMQIGVGFDSSLSLVLVLPFFAWLVLTLHGHGFRFVRLCVYFRGLGSATSWVGCLILR